MSSVEPSVCLGWKLDKRHNVFKFGFLIIQAGYFGHIVHIRQTQLDKPNLEAFQNVFELGNTRS